MKAISDVVDGGNPVSDEVKRGTAESVMPLGDMDPRAICSFKDHVLQMFSVDHGGCDESTRANTWTLVALANGLFFKGRYGQDARDAFADELVARMMSMDDDLYCDDPLLNALYLVAGEFLGLMHAVQHKRHHQTMMSSGY